MTDAEAAPVPPSLARAQVGVCFGCGVLILLSFAALAFTVVRSDRLFSNDPAAVEATLQSLVTCQLPPGYRGFMAADVPDAWRIAVVAPSTLEGKRLDLQVPLLISAWTFPPEKKSGKDRADAVMAFWESQVKDREFTLGKLKSKDKQAASLTLRGAAHEGLEVRFECERETVRLVFAEVARTGSEEPVVLAFVGQAAAFDEAALQAFLASVR